MKQLFILLLLFSVIVYGHNFRNADWGMSMEEVIQSEGNRQIADTGTVNTGKILLYYDTIFGDEYIVSYTFNESKGLILGGLMYMTKHANDNIYVDRYFAIKHDLIKKYGEPSESYNKWSRNTFKGDYDHRGLAVACEDLTIVSKWHLDDKDIDFRIFGVKYNIDIIIFYYSPIYDSIKEALDKKDIHNKF